MAMGDYRRQANEGVSDPYRLTAGATPITDNQSGRLRMMVDTAFFDLPMVLDGGPIAALTYLAAYFYITRHNTGGTISRGAVGALLDWSQLGITGADAAERCIAVGMMERAGNGYRLLDYHNGPNGSGR